MKKVLALVLAFALIATIAVTMVSAKGKQHFDFGWNFGFDCEEAERPQKPNDQQGKPDTNTDCPQEKPDRPEEQDKPDEGCPDEKPVHPQLPQRPGTDRVESGTDLETNTEIDTDTDVKEPAFRDIFDVVVELHKRGHHGKNFRIPAFNDLFALLDMVIDGDKVSFGFCRLDKEQPEFQEITMGELADSAPEGMAVIEMGDNNADGKVAANDALEILKHVVGNKPMVQEGRRILSDMNADEAIGADDALCVLKKVVGKSF